MAERAADWSTVVHCYRMFDRFFPAFQLLDYTEGIYHDDPATPYEVAQANQINYLLDEVQCRQGSKILDLGCGNGTLLDEVKARGAEGIGITISPEQVTRCRARGLDVRLVNYNDMANYWNGYFDAIVANGSIEHFVQPSEAASGEQDAIYRRLFQLCRRVLDPRSSSRRMVTTIIHFVRHAPPEVFLKSPLSFRPFSDRFHYAFLSRAFGGYYPSLGQLETCAQGEFSLVKEVDGTRDYHLTSEEWLRRGRRGLFSPRGMLAFLRSAPHMILHPRHFAALLTGVLITESWNWQFRGESPPTRLLRQTWQCVSA